jgi:hypothetical protein
MISFRTILQVIGNITCILSLDRLRISQSPLYLEVGLLIFGCVCLAISLVRNRKELKLKMENGVLLAGHVWLFYWALNQLRSSGLASLNLISFLVALFFIFSILAIIFSPKGD